MLLNNLENVTGKDIRNSI